MQRHTPSSAGQQFENSSPRSMSRVLLGLTVAGQINWGREAVVPVAQPASRDCRVPETVSHSSVFQASVQLHLLTRNEKEASSSQGG